MTFPEPVIAQAIEPKTKGDQEKMGIALQRFGKIRRSACAPMKNPARPSSTAWASCTWRSSSIACAASSGWRPPAKPQVSYRETIRKRVADVEGKFVRQSGGKGQYGHVVLTVEPNEPGKGFEFFDEDQGRRHSGRVYPGGEKGVLEALNNGVLAGYQVVDVKAHLTFGSYHDVDSSEQAFRMAAIFGFRRPAAWRIR